jgi:hypothetical protein
VEDDVTIMGAETAAVAVLGMLEAAGGLFTIDEELADDLLAGGIVAADTGEAVATTTGEASIFLFMVDDVMAILAVILLCETEEVTGATVAEGYCRRVF